DVFSGKSRHSTPPLWTLCLCVEGSPRLPGMSQVWFEDPPSARPAAGEGGWRRGRDSNPRYPCEYTRFPSVPVRPLRHLSNDFGLQISGLCKPAWGPEIYQINLAPS